jgi:hypothetical protein
MTFTTTVAFMDILSPTTDEIKLLSEQAITVGELLSFLDDDQENFQYYIQIESEFLPFFRGQDNTCGWTGDLKFVMKFEADSQAIRTIL